MRKLCVSYVYGVCIMHLHKNSLCKWLHTQHTGSGYGVLILKVPQRKLWNFCTDTEILSTMLPQHCLCVKLCALCVCVCVMGAKCRCTRKYGVVVITQSIYTVI